VYGRSAGGSLRQEEMQKTGKRGRAAGLRGGRSDERARRRPALSHARAELTGRGVARNC
jgi:hypothetical protein